MADERDIELSVDLDVGDAEKTAENLQKEIKRIFDKNKGEKSAAFTNLEIQMKKTYEQAESLRAKMLELSQNTYTEEYQQVCKNIEETQARLESLEKSVENQTGTMEFYMNTIREMYSIFEEMDRTGAETFTDVSGKIGDAGKVWNTEELKAYMDELSGITKDYNKIEASIDVVKHELNSLYTVQEQMEEAGTHIIIGKETQAYQDAEQQLDLLLDKEKQQIIHFEEIDAKEEAALQRQRELAAAEEERALLQAQLDFEREQATAQEIAQQEELLRLRAAEAEALQEHIELMRLKAQEEMDNGGLTEANKTIMALNMSVRSLGRLIPGVSTTALTSVTMLTRGVTKLTHITKAQLVSAIGAVKTAFAKLFAFIMAHPIILVITAIIAAIIALVKAIKKVWDEAEEAADRFIELAKNGLKELTRLSGEFIKTLVKGFAEIGLIAPRTLYSTVTWLINKLKSLKSIISENLDLMAQWNDGNNAVNTALSNITSSLNYLKASIANVVAPILVYVEPILTRLIDTLAKILNLISMVIAKLTGAKSYQQVVRVQNDYADSLNKTASAAKEAQAGLAGFDKLNVLSSNKGSATTKAADFKMFDFKDVELPDWILDFGKLGNKLSKQLNKFLKGIDWDFIKEKAATIGKDVADFINNFKFGKTLGITIGESINTITTTINSFFKKFKSKKFGKKLAKLIKAAIKTIKWDEVGEMFSLGINKLFGIVAGFTREFDGGDLGQAISDFISGALGKLNWTTINEAVSGLAEDLAQAINKVLTPENMTLVGTTLGNTINTLITGIQLFTDTAEWTQWGESIAAGIRSFFETIKWEDFGKTVSNLAEGLLDCILAAVRALWTPGEDGRTGIDVITDAVVDFFKDINWEDISKKAKEISQKLREGLEKIWDALNTPGPDGKTAFDHIIELLVDFLEEESNWDKMFQGFKSDFVGKIFWGKIKGIFNSILDGIWEFIQKASDSILSFIEGLIDVPFISDLVPANSISKDAFKAYMKTTKPSYLAEGAVLPPNKPFMAVVGDQKSGTNVEAPLATIQKAVADVIGDLGVNVVFEVKGDPNGLFKAVQKEAKMYSNRVHASAFS